MAACKGDPIRENVYISGGVIKLGDFVTQNAAGQVVVAAAGDPLLGVANAYCSASGQECQVWDHPSQMFLVPTSGTAPSAQTDFNLNYNIVAGTSTSLNSAHTLDSASGATTATLPLKALENYRLVGQNNAAAGHVVVVVINNHKLGGGTGTVGI